MNNKQIANNNNNTINNNNMKILHSIDVKIKQSEMFLVAQS
jgi:hypothetical protein